MNLMDSWLLSQSDDWLCEATAAAHDSTLLNELMDKNSDSTCLAHDSDLLKQAMLIIDCDFDRTLAQLKCNGR